MELFVAGDALVFNVIGDEGHRGIAHGIGIIALCPEVTAPQFCFHLWMFGKDNPGGDTFNFLHEI